MIALETLRQDRSKGEVENSLKQVFQNRDLHVSGNQTGRKITGSCFTWTQLQHVMQRTVPDTSPSIAFALKGNIDGLKNLFSRGLASPRDWALYGGMHQYRTVQFLMTQGAYVDDESYEHLFDFGFRQKCTDTELDELGCITHSRGDDWIVKQQFPPLHLIVFGLSPNSLAAELKDNPNAVRATDAQGRTALDWATARAQLDDMRLLLQHNSGINSMDRSGRSTILHAVDSHSVEAVRMLLEAGANPNPKVPKGLFRSSPLTAASFGGLADMVELLLQCGADVAAYNPEGQTALHAAVIIQNVKCARILLDWGASLKDVAHNGRTPLTLAIIHNSHAVLELFLDRRFECVTAAHIEGPQVLAVIAEHADAKTMSIIASSLPLKLSLAPAEDGFAAGREMLQQRTDYDENLGVAFEELLYSIVAAEEEAATSWTAGGAVII
ncbi:ankyrin [Parathielavia hyrcaniae]|uniref:Ankyrin n=1 Tax=Parathielavia hyrcaniae TaxID=113614 RepID=A0AAN6PS39_9PEZI|nr:ankyrin [Parathielavia hyrcaniae]